VGLFALDRAITLRVVIAVYDARRLSATTLRRQIGQTVQMDC
jgi:hypothetical protein